MSRTPDFHKPRRRAKRKTLPCEAREYRAFKIEGVRYIYTDACDRPARFEQEVLTPDGELVTVLVCRKHRLMDGPSEPRRIQQQRQPKDS